MKLNKAQEEIIKKKVGGFEKKIIVKPIPSDPIMTTMALGEEGNPPAHDSYK